MATRAAGEVSHACGCREALGSGRAIQGRQLVRRVSNAGCAGGAGPRNRAGMLNLLSGRTSKDAKTQGNMHKQC